MNDFLNSIKAHLYDRTTSPLFGAFAISWAIWNYKFLLIAFSSVEVIDKFRLIENRLYPNVETVLTIGLLLPFMTSLAFIFIYPYPARYVYRFVRNRQKDLAKIRQEIEDKTPLTQEESRRIRRDALRLELEYEQELERERTENKRLKEIVEELQEQLGETSSNELARRLEAGRHRVSNALSDISESQIKILDILSTVVAANEESIVNQTGGDKVRVKFELGDLEKRGFVESFGTDEDMYYKILHEGRGALLAHTDSMTDEDTNRLRPPMWDSERDRMSFEVDVGGESRRFYISREALEDHFDDSDSKSPETIFNENVSAIEEIAISFYADEYLDGREEYLITTADIPPLLKK